MNTQDTQDRPPAWRTVIVVFGLAIMCLIGFLATAKMPETLAIHTFDTLAWTMLGMAFVEAGKAGIEHLTYGNGIKGILGNLLGKNDSDPSDPPSQNIPTPLPVLSPQNQSPMPPPAPNRA